MMTKNLITALIYIFFVGSCATVNTQLNLQHFVYCDEFVKVELAIEEIASGEITYELTYTNRSADSLLSCHVFRSPETEVIARVNYIIIAGFNHSYGIGIRPHYPEETTLLTLILPNESFSVCGSHTLNTSSDSTVRIGFNVSYLVFSEVSKFLEYHTFKRKVTDQHPIVDTTVWWHSVDTLVRELNDRIVIRPLN